MTKHSSKRTKRPIRKGSKKPVTVEMLLEQAAAAMQSVQLEEAQELYQRALTLQPGNTDIMDSLADVCIQVGDLDAALALLQQSIGIAPDSNGTKWLYAAQLLQGKEAVQAYQRGIRLLEDRLNSSQEDKKSDILRMQAGAFCSIAELYLTDLCFDDGAEGLCEQAIVQSLKLDPLSLDANQTCASLRISQCRKADAIAILNNLIEPVSAAINKFRERNIIEEMARDSEDNAMLPSLESAVSLAKLLMECSDRDQPQLYDFVATLLEYVLDVDDENPDLWYLLGVNANNRPVCDKDTALSAFSMAHSMLDEMLEKDPNQEDAKCLLSKVIFCEENVGMQDIHVFAEKQGDARVVSSIAGIMKSAETAAMDEEEWSDDEETTK